MTAIAARFSKNRKIIQLASDSQTTAGGGKYTPEETSQVKSKIIQIERGYAIGCCGKVSEISLFQRYCKRTKPKGSTEDDIFDFMVDFQTWVKERISKFEFQTAHVLVFKGKLFTILRGFTVYEHKEYASAGSGAECIDVCFNMGGDARTAIEMAKKFNLYCGGETVLLDVEVL